MAEHLSFNSIHPPRLRAGPASPRRGRFRVNGKLSPEGAPT